MSSVPGKLLHRRQRALVMPGLLDIAAETQCGGLAGRATDVASHLLRQTVGHHRARKRSTIVVFVDVIAAFYNVVRPLVTDISPLLQDARLMDDESGMPSALAATSLDEHVLNSVTAQLVATWFSIVGSDTVSKFHRGVTPVDPEVDQQFTLGIPMLLNTFRAQLAIEGIEASIPHVPSDEAILSAGRAAPVTWNLDVSYVDDIAIAIPVLWLLNVSMSTTLQPFVFVVPTSIWRALFLYKPTCHQKYWLVLLPSIVLRVLFVLLSFVLRTLNS